MRCSGTRLTRRRMLRAIAGTLALGTVGAVLPAAADEFVAQPGDTVTALAARLGTSIDALARATGFDNPGVVVGGQGLTVPSPGALTSSRPTGSLSPGSILAERRLVTYYGNPWSSQMGILGALSKGALVDALRRRAAEYEAVGGRPVQPAVHMVVTVAQAGPGPDGLYRARMPASSIKEYVDLAADAGLLFVADIQVGRSTVAAELTAMSRFLEQPHVHLALDPEFDMWGSQVPGRELGHMTAAEVNHGMGIVADIAVRTGRQKILMVHQYAYSMLPDKGNIGNHPLVDVAIIMDGFGGQEIKTRQYDLLVRDSHLEYGGIKLFIDQDTDLMSASQLMALTPRPDVVIYQ